MTALRDEQGTAASKDSSQQTMMIKRNIFGVVQSKQLSTNDLAVFDLDAVVIICVERGSHIHGIRPLNKLTVGDVHRTLCKEKQTSALCATNGERNTSNRLWTCLLQQMRLEHFEIISSVSIST